MSQADHPLADLYARPGPDAWRRVGDGFQSASGRATKARWLIAAVVVVNVVVLALLTKERSLLEQGAGNISLTEWHDNESRIGDASLVSQLVFLASAVFFLRWLHLTYRNLLELGTDGMRFTPGWAVGYWFVPILNLWRPKQILDDAWRATDAAADESPTAWRSLPGSGLVTAWFVLVVLAGLVTIFGGQMARDTIAEMHSRNGVIMVSRVLEIAAGIALFRLVGELTARQDARAAVRSAPPTRSAATPVV